MNQIVGIHPHAEWYPLLSDEETAALAADIAVNGLRDPLTVAPDGRLIDGRNRYRACEIAGVEPAVVIYEGEDIGAFVRSRNLRRHQPVGSLAMSTALSMLADGLRVDGRWKRGSLGAGNQESLNTDWANKITQSGVVLDFKPDLAPAVVAGDLALDAAYQQAKAVKDSTERDKIMARERAKREKAEAAEVAERNARIVADLTQAGSKYVALIEDGTLTPSAAWSAYREDTRKQREQDEHARSARSDLYSGIARALSTLEVYGGYEDFDQLMAEYNPDELNPPQLARCFEHESLCDAAEFLTYLCNWAVNRAR